MPENSWVYGILFGITGYISDRWGANHIDLFTIYKSTVISVIVYGDVAYLPVAMTASSSMTHFIKLERLHTHICSNGFTF